MNAEEMFKELGYEKGDYNCRTCRDYVSEDKSIYFDGSDESISITNNRDNIFNENEVIISKDLLRVINKQVEELKENGEW